MDDQKQQIVERLKQANNILVTVSANPSVDQLAAAIGLTLVLNKMGKHGTTVFSGEVPSVIEFLQPDKTIEKNTDSLQDFIIALDKSKADKLRYKVEDSHVKIFITPYRTSITEKDLVFSQGDFNVEVVVALGVLDPQDLDKAITAHGRILHDATVISVSTKTGGNLGSINWSNQQSSSLCEMVVGITDLLGEKIVDDQMATAFLTGIVAETQRFSNAKTSAITMGVSAKLMAAGANQQLIATKLEKPVPTPPTVAPPEKKEETKVEPVAEDPLDKLVKDLNESEKNSTAAQAKAEILIPEPPQLSLAESQPVPDAPLVSPDGSLQISHNEAKVPEDDEEPEVDQIRIDEQGILKKTEDNESVANLNEPSAKPTVSKMVLEPPSLGGTLTANAHVPGLGGTNDPMSMPQLNKPLLSHESPVTIAKEPSIELPVPVAPGSESEPVLDATSHPVLKPILTPPRINDVPSVKQPSPAGVPLDDPTLPQQSLADLEDTVKRTESPTQPAADVSNARDAIKDAIDSTHTPSLEPIAALNSQELGSAINHEENKITPVIDVAEPEENNPGPALLMPDLPATNNPSSVDTPQIFSSTAPPAVPPPMMPPLQ